MDIDVFVSYHMESSLHIVETIVNKLEMKNIRCWYAQRDARGAYGNSIAKAIDKCTVFLLILNKQASESQHVLNELELVFNRIGDNESVSMIVFHTADSMNEISREAQYYIRRQHWIDATILSLEQGIQKIVDQIIVEITHYDKDLFDTIKYLDKKKDNTYTNHIRNSLHSTYHISNRNFIGRKEELLAIHTNLEKERIVFVYGIGGLGKTQIAKEYIKQYRDNYDTVIMAHYETSLLDLLISDKYFSIDGFEREKTESDVEFGYRKMKKIKELSSEKTLIIVDNFDTDHDDLLEDFLNASYCIIFTTRINFEYLGLPLVCVDTLKENEQLSLFIQNYRYTLSQEDKLEVKEIISRLSGHTLAIELVAKLMASRRMKPKNMNEQLQKFGIHPVLVGDVKYGFKKANTIYGHIEQIFNMSVLSVEEMNILLNLSLMPISGIGIDECIELCELEHGEVIDALINRSWIQYDKVRDYIYLHPVIADVVKSKGSSYIENCGVFITNLAKKFRVTWGMNKEDKIKYGELAKSLYRKYPIQNLQDINIYRGLLHAFKFCEYVDLMKDLLINLFQIWKEEDTLEYAWISWEISDIYLLYQSYDKALNYSKKTIKILEKIGDYPYDLAYVYKHHAHIYHAKCEHISNDVKYLQKAREYLIKSEKLYNLAIQNPDTQYGSLCYSFGLNLFKEHAAQSGSRYYAYAFNCYYSGNYNKAVEYGLKAYELLNGINGEIDSDTTAPMRVLAITYSKLERFEEAIDMELRVINARQQLWGINQFRYFEHLGVLSDIYYECGKIEDCLKILHHLLELLKDNTRYVAYTEKIKRKIEKYSTQC